MNRHADTNVWNDPRSYLPDLYAQRASVEHYEKLARQARRKVKARAFIGYAVMVLVAVAIGIMLAVGHS